MIEGVGRTLIVFKDTFILINITKLTFSLVDNKYAVVHSFKTEIASCPLDVLT